MEKERLIEIRNSLAMLPVLQKRMEHLNRRIYEAEKDVKALLNKYEAESLDVEQMKKDSLSATILKLVGKYEGKLNKETNEMLAAKIEYHNSWDRVKELYLEKNELGSRISKLNDEKRIYESELKKRQDEIAGNTSSEIFIKYRKLVEESEMLSKQLVETDEAVRAAKRVYGTAKTAMQHLDKADGWATYDIWAKGGLLSHMAKYNHIDNAQSDFNRLNLQIRDLQKELADVNLLANVELTNIDSVTRTVDYWFDNIFTDLNVRGMIRENQEQLRRLLGKINSIMSRLERNKSEINKQLIENEKRKNDLIISG